MEIKFNGKTIELSFGLKFLNIIDKEMGMEAEQVNFGKGTEMLVPALESHSVCLLYTSPSPRDRG